jgi:hypothetical protein
MRLAHEESTKKAKVKRQKAKGKKKALFWNKNQFL